jgi:hypothetical protein
MVRVLFTTGNLTISKYHHKICIEVHVRWGRCIEVQVGDLGRCGGIPEVRVASAVLITGYGWNKEIAGSNKTTEWVVLTENTYLEPVLSCTEVATRVSVCTNARKSNLPVKDLGGVPIEMVPYHISGSSSFVKATPAPDLSRFTAKG